MNLNSMIMDVEISDTSADRIRLKFLAISGGCGPEIEMPVSIARKVAAMLAAHLDEMRAA